MTRLSAICDMISTPYILDIGSDHGFVPKMMFDMKGIKHAFVTDISPKCLRKAKDNLRDYDEHTTFLCGDGLRVIDGEMLTDCHPITAVITGMGGEEIKKILSYNIQLIDYFILGPQSNVFDLKKFLIMSNFKILQDKIVKEDKMFYNLLLVRKVDSYPSLPEHIMYFGEENIRTMPSVFREYVLFLLDRYEKLAPFRQDAKDMYDILQNILGGKYV